MVSFKILFIKMKMALVTQQQQQIENKFICLACDKRYGNF